MSKINHSLFEAHEHALEQAYGACPLCSGRLTLKHGKSGVFIGCNNYPECHFSKPLHETETTEIKPIEGSHCPECQQQLTIKKGRYGLFIGCSNFPACHHIEPIKKQTVTSSHCPLCHQGNLVQRTNKYGKHFYACDRYPGCKYVLNSPPVEKECPNCGWSVMTEKETAQGRVLECPQKRCQYQQSRDE